MDSMAHGVSSYKNLEVSYDGQILETKFAKIDHAGNGDNEIVAAVAGFKIRVLHYTIVATAAVNTKWRSDTTDLSGDLNWDAASKGLTVSNDHGLVQTAAGEALNLNLSGAVAVDGHITYVEVPV